MKAIIFLRVSTEEQAEKGYSIPNQRSECTKKASELGCDDVFEYCDEGISGSILARPGLMDAIHKMKHMHIDYFIALDSTRLSREAIDSMAIARDIKNNGTVIAFVRGFYDDSPEGQLQYQISASVGEYEKKVLLLRSYYGKREKAKQGLLTHSPGLYGYDFDKESDTLSINESEAAIIKLMYKWLIEEGIGPNAIAKRLIDMGIPSKKVRCGRKLL
ncbi:MAG: hypothetical protein A2Y23_14605 [Clostridiales bacterium GWB2_37_7]|nr:MAG: hypothetical protein A2Y23_14605 [Clostridiales bacterium GWB2_37_7]